MAELTKEVTAGNKPRVSRGAFWGVVISIWIITMLLNALLLNPTGGWIVLLTFIASFAVYFPFIKRRLRDIGYKEDGLLFRTVIALVPIAGLYYLIRCLFSPAQAYGKGAEGNIAAIVASIVLVVGVPVLIFISIAAITFLGKQASEHFEDIEQQIEQQDTAPTGQ